MIELDRGVLARVDRRLLAGLAHDQTSRMVRVPASEALWATWRRYCAALGVPMGRAIATLIACEIERVADREERSAVLSDGIESRVIARSEELDKRERRLEQGERSIRMAEQRLRARASPYEHPRAKPGRNEPCPCGSGLKYKRCHGL